MKKNRFISTVIGLLCITFFLLCACSSPTSFGATGTTPTNEESTKTVKSIAVTAPTKTGYSTGEQINYAGMKITVT